MAYTKINFKDRSVENPKTYNMVENEDGSVTLYDHFGTITEAGTPLSAENMNHLEDGIAGAETYADNKITTLLEAIYPVGAVYISVTETCPIAALLGTWVNRSTSEKYNEFERVL